MVVSVSRAGSVVNLEAKGKGISHFNLDRDTAVDCAPTLLNFIGQSATGNYSDRAQIHAGAWRR